MTARVRRAGGLLIVNDRADIARMSGAVGVHVGQEDLSPEDVRRVVGPDRIVGRSTHSGVQVEAALLEPISYVAIGPVFATRTKGAAAAAPVGLSGVRGAAARAGAVGVPVVAIGGITLACARDVVAAGASSIAVISDLLSEDAAGRARAYLDVLT
jgi:thiamine-phosphate pyrophosphorylase